jgi:hypothetical protein
MSWQPFKCHSPITARKSPALESGGFSHQINSSTKLLGISHHKRVSPAKASILRLDTDFFHRLVFHVPRLTESTLYVKYGVLDSESGRRRGVDHRGIRFKKSRSKADELPDHYPPGTSRTRRYKSTSTLFGCCEEAGELSACEVQGWSEQRSFSPQAILRSTSKCLIL